MSIPNSRSIPVEYIKECFEYREECVDGVLQGNLYWRYREDMPKRWNSKMANKKAGSINGQGYYIVEIKYNNMRCVMKLHNVVWILNVGYYPDDVLDHEDNNRTNNLISNLRKADTYLNNLNIPPFSNKLSQYKGVSYVKDRLKWYVNYSLNYKNNFVGYFDDELEAALAYNEAISKVHNTDFAYFNDISMGYTNKAYPNMPRNWVPEELAA
jgi:hypothetical protein